MGEFFSSPLIGMNNVFSTSFTGPTDYDYRGYTEKYGRPDQSKGQHLTDEFKLPNHITFSTESKYSKPGQEGGVWYEKEGTWHFQPSWFNLLQHSPDELKTYFEKYEPDAVLDLE